MTFGHPRSGIDKALLGELSADEEAKVRSHVRGCVTCRAYYDAGLLALRTARGGVEREAPFEAARLTRLAMAESAPPAPARLPWGAVAAAALAAMLVSVVGVWLVREQSRPIGTVFSASGTLLVDGHSVTPGQVLTAGSRLEAKKGDATVTIAGVRGVLLREGAVLVTDSETQVSLLAGRGRFTVKPKSGPFRVTAGQTKVDVVGTIFAVDRRKGGPEDTLVAVHRGKVEVTNNAGSVSLTEGKETLSRPGTTPVAATASASALEEDRPSNLLEWLRNVLRQLVDSLDRAVNGASAPSP